MTHQLLFLCPHEDIDIFFEVVVASLGEPPFELVPEAFNAVGVQVLVGGVNIMFTMVEPPVAISQLWQPAICSPTVSEEHGG